MSSRKLLFGLITIVLLLWIATPFFVGHLYAKTDERGKFGDLFGTINSLFSGLAFAGLFYTVHLQAKQLRIQNMELKVQRQELRLQREEMKASRTELANQVRIQQALIKATVAQIEAKKLESEAFAPSGRQNYWVAIEQYGNALSALASKLEAEIPSVYEPPTNAPMPASITGV